MIRRHTTFRPLPSPLLHYSTPSGYGSAGAEALSMDMSNMSPEDMDAYIRGLQHLNNLQLQAYTTSPLLASLIQSVIPPSPVARITTARGTSTTSEIGSIPEEDESPPISVSSPSPSSVTDMTSVSASDDLTARFLLQLLQQQVAASTAVSTAASMPNLNLIGSLSPFQMPPPTTVPSSLAGLSLFSTANPSSSTLLEQQLSFQSSLMRPRVNSAASSSTSSSSLSSPNPTSSPERRRKRARSLLIKAEEAAAKINQDAKLKRSDALAELIEDEQQRRELAATVMAASANGTLTTLKSSTSPATKGLLDEFPKITLRPLIPDSKLPDSVGPDSPYRHHPKYQKKIADAATDFNLGMSLASFTLGKDSKKDGEDSSPSSTSSSLSSLQGNPEALKMMLSKFMDDVISGELVASN